VDKTFVPKKQDLEKKWWLINAEGRILGRLATEIAVLLRGKNNPKFAPHLDCGDFVIVINAEKVKVTGKKQEQKKYYSHSGYPGGLKEHTFDEMLMKRPEEIIKKAVWGMIPKNKLGRAVFKKLKVYQGPEHPHEAQNPQEYSFQERQH
jgi:large subunit ribosomal protein L13